MIERTNSRCSSNSHRTLQLRYPSARAPQKPIRSPRLFIARLAFACSCLLASHASPQGIEYRSLPELIDQGSKALVRGDFPQAAQAFNAIRENYQEEPIWLEGELPAKILPLAGLASHKANLQSEAILALESYLESYATSQDTEIFARYTLASSLLLDGQKEAARKHFAALRKSAGHSPFRDLASLREAQLSEASRAIEILETLVAAPASPRLATFARLRLIQLLLEQGEVENARIHLLDTAWPAASMPELATLTFLASEIGDKLAAEQPADALLAYQLTSPKAELIEAQENRIVQLQQRYHALSPALKTEQSMWTDQFRQSIKQLRSQLETLREAPDYQQAIDLRKARCFARINRPLEAWILLQPIASGDNESAKAAHLEWISVARTLHAWNAAALIAQDFIKKYPRNEDIPQILLWIALSQIEQGTFSEAIPSLESLIEKEPPTAIAAAAHYYLGFSRFNLGQTEAAIKAFRHCALTSPKAPIASQATLWIGICEFTTNQLEKAISTFQDIQGNPSAQFLHPEAAFREATCHYAMGKLDAALAQAQQWISKFSEHARSPELYLLLGDIRFEQNNIEAAIAAYAKVETDDSQIRYLALEKQAQLLIDTGRKEEALSLLESYRSKAPVPPPYIGSFTQLLTACLTHHDAQKELADAVEAYGNNLQANGIIELIHLLDKLPDANEEQATLASRILVSKIQTHRKQSRTTQAKLAALELASRFDRTDLPPPALIEAGTALTEIASLDAPLYFQRVLNAFPESLQIDGAHIGLAHYYAKQNAPSEALAHLLQASQHDIAGLALKLELERQLQQTENARRTAETILTEREATPSDKAKALLTLGDIALKNENPSKAYAYYQRIFTLYRGETEYVASAYSHCIQILDSDNRNADARKVATEFLAQTDLESYPDYQGIRDWLDRAEVTQALQAPPAQ